MASRQGTLAGKPRHWRMASWSWGCQIAAGLGDAGTAVVIARSTPLAGGLVLGVDAAWTAHQPSGVALVQHQGERWRCLGLAPSYAGFMALAEGRAVDWSARAEGSQPNMAALLQAAEQLSGSRVDLIAFDMPLSTEPIGHRRQADRDVSRVFGSRGCAVHSPTVQRPGAIADGIRQQLEPLGYRLQVAGDRPAPGGLIEVYPHVALLALLERPYRVPYKVSRSLQYWRAEHLPVTERILRLLAEFRRIRDGLAQHIEAINLPLPHPTDVQALAALKPLEDGLDALICSWVAIEHLQGRTQGLGDATAAIWCPMAAFAQLQAPQR
jgi:predicted RNase H-like nuclease